jgi:hypothetical protein
LKETPASSWDSLVYGIPDNLPEVGVAKARLVSAKIKISFRGPILQQGGTVMGAATFLGTPGIIAASDDDNKIYLNSTVTDPVTQVPRRQANWRDIIKPVQGQMYSKDFSPFEEKVLSNAIWAKNVNITKDANGICAVYVPMDPMDEIFYKTGTYYGEEVNQDVVLENDLKGTTILYSDKGARLSYLFNIQGIPVNQNPITVETYTNWEVLPTDMAASSLRNSNSTPCSIEDYTRIREMMRQYFNSHSGIHTIRGDTNLGSLRDVLSYLGEKVEALGKNLITKIFA